MKLFLLDAYALIYRAYYAFIAKPLINSKGQRTAATWGFLNTLEDVLTCERPTHIGVAFDPHGGTFRHKAYPQYKAQREATPEDISWSVPVIKELLDAYRIPVLEVPGFEADDVIGTLSTKADMQGIDTYMMTPDKDYAQLVTGHVKMFRPQKNQGEYEMMGVEEVCQRYGIERPEQVIDILGLMGDASDNIPGCPGVGEKTAVKLLAQFGSIENMLQHPEQIKGTLRQKVEENSEQIMFSKYLATIRRDVPIELDLEALAVKEPDEPRLRQMLSDLELNSILRKKFQLPTVSSTTTHHFSAATHSFSATADSSVSTVGNKVLTPDMQSVTVPGNKTASYPVSETLHPHGIPEAMRPDDSGMLSIFTLLDSQQEESIPQNQLHDDTDNHHVTLPENITIVSLPELDIALPSLQATLENPDTLKVGYDLKRDINRLAAVGITLRGPLFDIMIAHYLMHPELKHDLAYISETMLGTALTDNNRHDVIAQLYILLSPTMQSEPLHALFNDIEMPLVPVLAQMERNGVRLHTPTLQATSNDMRRRLAEIEDKAHRIAGIDFNLASPKQVGEVLFERLNIAAKAKKTRGGKFATNETILQAYADSHPIIPLILEHRGTKKLLSTYIDALPTLISPIDAHIHTSFNQAVTVTGRLSSSNPNLQNIPIRDEEGRFIRCAFIPEEGDEWFSADYSQIELRLMAHLSGDKTLIEDFLSGHDIHAATAAKIFHKQVEDVTREERTRAKTANFGIIYGITTFGLAERLKMSHADAKALIDGYFATYPRVKQYMDESIQRARDCGYAETLFGRRCYLPDINSRNATVRGFAERNAINAPIQGTAADIIKMAMVRIQRRLWDEHLQSRLILQVHDELNLSVPPAEHATVEQMVISEMQSVATLRVPLVADAGWGTNWLEAH